ncbi:FxSxx-COOH system tetratricopeptide repeat protein [Dactylosporangium siamense]|uniref:Cytochrome c n=1 Tax=Dactylosporangium siamense TaxID=685454 RepID=A0A919U5M6_9ACTN|nr:FxSxx-COOH system tetratricopeptide repeat protein [Dactylosporangium siamense]GIG42507.1 cytochrome c [Dactylosporangium siamense]
MVDSTPSARPSPGVPRQWPTVAGLAGFEIADALWLASRPGFGRAAVDDGAATEAPRKSPDDVVDVADPPTGGPGLPTARPPADDGPYFVPVPPDGSGETGSAVWEGRLAARSVVGSHRVPSRADTLGALRLVVASPVTRELDEESTAELGVVTRRWTPVLRPTAERRWDAVVVIDESPLIDAWHDAIADFVAGLRRQAVFRTIQVRWLVEGEHGGVMLRSGPGGAPETAASVVDLTGRRMVFVLTQSWSGLWRRGAVQRVAARWAASMVVTTVHLMPQELWRQTLATTAVTWHPDGPARCTGSMSWTESGLGRRGASDFPEPGTVAIPVLELGEGWLRRWSRLVAGTGTGPVTMPAVITSPHYQPPPASGGASASDLVIEFRASRSPTARVLATLLAAAPLTDEMIWAIQRFTPRAGPSHLVEVLSSDLIQPTGLPGARRDRGAIAYEFADGVRERLLSLGQRDRTIAVQDLVEEILAGDVPGVRGLGSRVRHPHSVAAHQVDPASRPHARVELKVYQALSGPHLVAHRHLKQVIGGPLPMLGRNVDPVHLNPGASTERIMSESSYLPTSGADSLPEAGAGSAGVANPRTDPASDGRPDAITNNLPPRNLNFTGRRDLLDALHRRLRSGTTAVLPEAVHGSGGVGKSQLVIEYVHQRLKDYDLIWWIPAERPAQITSALVELAQKLGISATATATTAVPLVLDALRLGRPHSNWLLIFDNAESPEEVQRFFPLEGTGSIVVTSRNPQWTDVADGLRVDVFDRHESIELLRKRSPALLFDEADRLSAALGDLPLAIELAAAYRAATEMPADEYLEKLNGSLAYFQDDVGGQDFPDFVAAAWNIALDAVEKRDREALRLLQVVAFLAPEPISEALLQRSGTANVHPDLDRVLRNKNRLTQAIRSISRFSLARMDYRTNSFQLHRLAQRVLIAQLSAEDREAMRQTAHLLLAGANPGFPDEAQKWPLFAELYPHIIASAAERSVDERVHTLILDEAKYLWRWGDLTGARDFALRAHDAWTEALGEDHPDTLNMAYWLGFMYFVVGDYPAAARINARTVELNRETFGENSQETLSAIGAVAADYRIAGDFASALDQSSTVYERAQRNFGDEVPETLRAAHNLAVSMRLSGRYDQALQVGRQTHNRLILMYGTNHLITLDTYGGVNLDSRELGDWITARNQQENVVDAVRRLVGDEDHPDLLRQSHSLAIFRRKAGDQAGALQSSTDVLKRYRYRYGDRHPDTVLATLTSSIDLRVTGDLSAALVAGAFAVDRLRELYGPTHPHTAGAEVDHAIILRLSGGTEDARIWGERAHRVLADRLDEQHALVLASGINLASAYYALGALQAAHDLDFDMLRRCRSQLGVNHPTTLCCAHNLGLDLRGLSRESDAVALLEDTMARFRAVLGPDHPATVAAVEGIRANCDIDLMPL